MSTLVADDCFDVASLEAFTGELVEAGFEPIEDSGRRVWRGPIHSAFASLTNAQTMIIAIVPGWPFQPPNLFVEGLNTNHSMLNGFVCMWREGDPSLRWLTVEGLFARIVEWCENAKGGWENDDLGRDAILNFQPKCGILATFDLSALRTGRGGWGDFHGVANSDPFRVELKPGHCASTEQLRGLWFRVGELDTPPPRQLSEVSRCLSRAQRKGLERALRDRRKPDALVASGGVDLILFCWERRGRIDLLVMACKGMDNSWEAIALQTGPNDERSLILRAGPDAPTLRSYRVALFGAGALGGNVAVALAESGLGSLDIVDSDVLAPGNVVRHVAGHDQVGASKVRAVEAVVRNHAPWTEVTCQEKSPNTPSDIGALIANADVIVDATGDAAFTRALAMTASAAGKPLIAGALYRGGFIARVQRQALTDDTPIGQRAGLPQYLVIPPGGDSEDLAIPDVGCSAPVNNAPPAAVLSCSSLMVQAVIDVLTKRFEFDDEVIDVYRPLSEPPFDRIGRVDIPYADHHNTAR